MVVVVLVAVVVVVVVGRIYRVRTRSNQNKKYIARARERTVGSVHLCAKTIFFRVAVCLIHTRNDPPRFCAALLPASRSVGV